MKENQFREREQELAELQAAVQEHGGAGEDQPAAEAELQALQRDFQQLHTPLALRRDKLEAAKAIHQYYRDLADELVRGSLPCFGWMNVVGSGGGQVTFGLAQANDIMHLLVVGLWVVSSFESITAYYTV